jgi:hypothetical protein
MYWNPVQLEDGALDAAKAKWWTAELQGRTAEIMKEIIGRSLELG